MTANYLYIWRYDVHEIHATEFVKAYGADGDWAQLFKGANGYVRTELYRDTQQPRRYFTIDYWESEAHYRRFRDSMLEAYKAMDARFDAWTVEEVQIGGMNPV